MPVNLVIRSQKYYNQYKNGVSFGANLGDYTNNLTGLVWEIVRVVMEVDINWSTSATANDVWNADTINLSISRSTGNWFNDGFSVGDVCDWLENGVIEANITITAISQNGSTIYYTLNSGAITDTNNAQLNGLTYLSALEYGFGLLGNGGLSHI